MAFLGFSLPCYQQHLLWCHSWLKSWLQYRCQQIQPNVRQFVLEMNEYLLVTTIVVDSSSYCKSQITTCEFIPLLHYCRRYQGSPVHIQSISSMSGYHLPVAISIRIRISGVYRQQFLTKYPPLD